MSICTQVNDIDLINRYFLVNLSFTVLRFTMWNNLIETGFLPFKIFIFLF